MELAKKTDAPQIFAIESAYIACPWTLTQIEEAIENPAYIVVAAKDCGMVVGYGSLRIAGDVAELNNIAVAVEVRGRGYGTAIIEELLQRAHIRGVREFFLEVESDNFAAVALYQKHGFACIAMRKNYYGMGRDAHIYKLECEV